MKAKLTLLLAVTFLMNSAVPVLATPQIWRVRKTAPPFGDGLTWDTAFDNLQDAISVAVADDSIWVTEGTYLPGDDSVDVFSFPQDGVQVLGGFPSTGDPGLEQRLPSVYETILNGDIGTDPGDHDDYPNAATYDDN